MVAVRERILAAPGASPAPPPATTGGFDEEYVALAREWNRRVPAGAKVYPTRPSTFERFVGSAPECFEPWDPTAWIERCRADGCALFPDA
ncbi:hypothetical protein OG948_43360 (plasmid) [Embleya sp. NBC_00888]|uniref:hypothetical protein n=1 Tax=Embleya sp. NBC_00888 TaxID=2975960 RepID=UPI00386F6BEF|nr:hypothetical protein OG948_43360 [Embleya sp. NBC_00888]